MHVVALVTEAFGGHGGIARFNRDLLTAICDLSSEHEVTVLPRLVGSDREAIPVGIDFRSRAAGGVPAYLREWLRLLSGRNRYDMVVCGHIHLLPLAELLRRRHRAYLLLFIHGIDAWHPTGRRLTDWLAKRVDAAVSVSDFTRRRFARWAGLPQAVLFVLPNTVHAEDYGLGDKPAYLEVRYRLHGKKVVMTLGRLSAAERYKGIDEVLELMPDMLGEDPDVHYLVVGDGDDRPRLEAKAEALGVRQAVTFAGRIPESEKADHYRLTDAFVMAGRGEGFGIVFLEAMACGIPVVASTRDGSREAVLDGKLGLLADPNDPASLRSAINRALQQPRRIPEGLDYFAYPRFCERLAGVFAAIGVSGGRLS